MNMKRQKKDRPSLPKEVVKDLIEGRLDPDTLKTIQSRPKDEDGPLPEGAGH